VTLGVQQDFLFMASSTATCAGGNEYACFGSGGDYYSGIPYEKSGDEIKGGPSPATTRILAGYDRVLGGNFTIGARLGFAFGGGPKAPGGRGFLPFHGEARVAYWFGHAPFERSGARPYLVIGGGMAQVDSKVGVVAYDTAQDYVDGKRMKLDAWKKSGTGFVGGGAGLMIAITPRTGPLAELKVVELLGASSPSLNLQLGYAVAF
jgi:hypothetical protein